MFRDLRNKLFGSSGMQSPGYLLLLEFHELFRALAQQHNERVEHELPISIEGPVSVDGPKMIARMLVMTAYRAISVRCDTDGIELFLIPSVEIIQINSAESLSRKRLDFAVQQTNSILTVRTEEAEISSTERELLLRSLFKDLINKSNQDRLSLPGLSRQTLEQSLAPAVWDLIREKEELTRNLVADQEAVRNSISRDIHDEVLSELLYLRRCFTGEQRLSDEDVIAIIDGISSELRSVCSALSPRDLAEWGLKISLEDLATRICKRSGIELTVLADDTIPELPLDIQIQVYRIVQECFNNIEKHARATSVSLEIKVDDGSLILNVRDNGSALLDSGVGSPPGGGGGRKIMRERTQFISQSFPANLSIASVEPAGVCVTLTLQIPASEC